MQVRQFEVHAALEQSHWWFVARRQIVRSLIESLTPPSKDSLVVEVGCGTGGNVADIGTIYDCVGIDINSDAIECARQLYPSSKFVCGVAPGDIHEELQRADVVLLLDVLEHVADDFLLLSQLLASMRPDSYLILTVPADLELWSQHDVSFGHFRRYDRERLQAIWSGIAVVPLLCSYFNSRLYLPIKWIRRINRRLDRTSGQGGTDFAQPSRLVNGLLSGIFAGERRVLTKALANSPSVTYRRGVSLVAVLRREAGSIPVRTKPAGLPEDFFNPVTSQYR